MYVYVYVYALCEKHTQLVFEIVRVCVCVCVFEYVCLFARTRVYFKRQIKYLFQYIYNKAYLIE